MEAILLPQKRCSYEIALGLRMNDLRSQYYWQAKFGMKQFAENLRLGDISHVRGVLTSEHFYLYSRGISRWPDRHLTNLKAEIGSRTLTGYPSDV
jgi:hypothetical protein